MSSSILAKKYKHIDSYYPRVADHLIGRNTEYGDLLGLLNATAVDGKRVCFIEGKPGSGKSFLARSLIVPTEEMGGMFASGKCDQFHLSSPYDVISQCLTNIVDQILLLDPTEISEYKKELKKTLGFSANILVRMVPKLEPLLAEIRESEREESFDFESTFQFSVLQCLRVFSTKNSPLVIFIDDLQWIDKPSLKFIKSALEARELSNVLIVLAYRSEEYKQNQAVVDFKNEHASSLKISVKDFSVQQVENYLKTCFGDVKPSMQTLTELLYKKTAGNPFYVGQLLKTLLQKKILVQDPDTKTWRWTLDSLNRIPINEDAAKFLENKILGLDSKQKEILSLMSCYGAICEKDVIDGFVVHKDELDETLAQLLNKGFLIEANSSDSFRFSHDRIQQASFQALVRDDVEKVHWDISQTLLSKDREWVDKYILKIINHLNKGSKHASTSEQGRLIYELNLKAADAAIFSIAYSDALDYCMSAIDALNTFDIKLETEQQFEVYFKTALCAQLGRKFDVMESYLEKIEKRANEVEVLKALEIRISALLIQTKYEEAYEIFRVTLSKFDYNFPKTGSSARIVQELIKTESYIAMKGMKVFKDMKPTEDKKVLIVCRLLSIVFPGVYFSNADLVPIITCMWLRLSMSKGYTIETPIAMGSYAMILAGFLGKPDKGMEVAEIAKTLLDNDKSENYAKYRAYSVLSNHALHLKYHWNTFYSLAEKSFIRALQFGDHEFAGFNASARIYFAYEAGERLEDILRLIDIYNEKIKPIAAKQVLDQFYRVNSRICKLRGIDNKYRGEGGVDYEGDYETLYKSIEGKSPVTLYTVKMDRSMFAYFDANFVEAFQTGAEIVYQLWAPVSAAESNIALFTFLAGSRILEDKIPSNLKIKHIKKVTKKCAKIIEQFATTEHVTNHHRNLAVKAITHSLKGKYSKANTLFLEAIKAVDANYYRTDAGLLKELYGRFLIKYRYLDENNSEEPAYENMVRAKAREILMDALQSYEDWGATLLSSKLVNRYKDLIQTDIQAFDSELSTKEYDSLLNSLQDIAGYKTVSDFHSNFIKLVKGYISGIDVAFSAHLEKGEWFKYSVSEDISESTIPKVILHRAQNTLENNFVGNVEIEPGISKDSFILENKIRSFYSVALTHQSKLIGLVYLGSKSELVNGAKHLHLIEFLSRQASATLANTLLVSDLTESKNQFRQMYDSSKTGMLRIKANGQIVSINQTVKNWLCSDDLDFIGDKKPNIWSFDWPEKVEIPQTIREMQEAELDELEKDISTLNKSKKAYIALSCVRVKADGHEYFDFSFNDNTESVEREFETRNRLLAEEKVKDSSRFIANVSHELRTPLTIILGLAKQLLTSGKDLSVDTVNVLDGTIRNGNRLLKLVNDLLEFTKAKKSLDDKALTVNVSTILEEICGAMSVYMDMYGQRDFSGKIEPGLLIKGFSDDLARIAFNLIQNAFKFTNETDGKIEVKLAPEKGNAVLIISDNGLGIPDSEKENIFDRFFQASNNANEGNGVGIGLSLVKNMVERHDGQISMESTEGEGTTFKISFPLVEESSTKETVVDSITESVKEMEMSSFENARRKQFSSSNVVSISASDNLNKTSSILIIDDEPDIRNYFRELLLEDFTIYEADGGIVGLESVEENDPELILLDMMMPKMNGLDVLQELKQRGCESKIIVLSAQNQQEVVVKALEMGADDFILKTVDGLELKAKVKNLIKNRSLEDNLRYLNNELQLKINDIKKTEAQLVHIEKNESISHIAKGVLHELNNPLNVSLQEISFLQTVLVEGMGQEGFDVAKDALSNAWQMQNRMADILADLKDYSNQNKLALLKKEDMSSVVESAIKINKYELASLEVETNLQTGLVAELKKSEIMQVLTNLITNASKALKLNKLDRPPKIKIETTLVENKIRVSVEDNGPGIKDEVKEKIFESFYTEFEKESSGLGLNICKIILTNHNSKLEVESDGESFTRFYFDLPCDSINSANLKEDEYA